MLFTAKASCFKVCLFSCVGIIGFTFAAGLAVFNLKNLNVPLNYSDMASIYSTVTPMDLEYNSEYVTDSGDKESTEAFFDSLLTVAGSGTLTKSA